MIFAPIISYKYITSSRLKCNKHIVFFDILNQEMAISSALNMKSSAIVLMLAILGIFTSQTTSRQVPTLSMLERHEKWIQEYGRVYDNVEERAIRYKIFKDNVEFIERFNEGGDRPYKLGINAFADQTNEEFRAARNGLKTISSPKTTLFKYENVSVVPPSIDWRTKGAVTPVKDQGQCGKTFPFLVS